VAFLRVARDSRITGEQRERRWPKVLIVTLQVDASRYLVSIRNS
jgi:hypothetical protein